jgi:hypothetical protein
MSEISGRCRYSSEQSMVKSERLVQSEKEHTRFFETI